MTAPAGPADPPRRDPAGLMLLLYDRPLHPELFEAVACERLVWSGGAARVLLHAGGHVIEVSAGGGVATEVLTACGGGPLPEAGRLTRRSLARAGDVAAEPCCLRYSASCHGDRVDAEVFERLDREATLDARRATLSARLPGGGRLAPAPVSFLTAEPVDGGLSVTAVHTFPAASTVVRTQSLFELG